jgi:hypothetical protein
MRLGFGLVGGGGKHKAVRLATVGISVKCLVRWRRNTARFINVNLDFHVDKYIRKLGDNSMEDELGSFVADSNRSVRMRNA